MVVVFDLTHPIVVKADFGQRRFWVEQRFSAALTGTL
jgi:hypothetical protein